MSPEQKLALREIVDLFDEAERKVKEVEQFSQELSVPSINELRYVGYHLARALCEDNADAVADQLKKARGHCQRAIYDAHEIGIIHMLEQIRAFKDGYQKSSHVVVEVIPDYVDLLVSADKATEFIVQIGQKNPESRDGYYRECAPHYATLKGVLSKLTIASPVIDGKISASLKAEQKVTRRFILTVSLTIFGLLVSAAIGGTLIYLNLSHGN